jgi:hypothetical protein
MTCTNCHAPRFLLPRKTVADPHLKAAAFGARHKRFIERAAHAAPPPGTGHVSARPIPAGGFDFPTQLVGSTPDGMVTVYFDPTLGAQAQAVAEQVFTAVDAAFKQSAAWFASPGAAVSLVLASLGGETDGSGGAYHYACDFVNGGDIYVSVAFGNPQMDIGLFVAELVECFQMDAATGWDCGGSNGEALSRYLAEAASGGPTGSLSAFSTGPTWASANYPNWVDATESTDQDDIATGCGVVFLGWLAYLGHTTAQITQAGCPDGALASCYTALTGKATAWADFTAAVNGLGSAITGDDPWPAAKPPPPPPPPPPPGGEIVTVNVGAKTVTMPAGWTASG